MQSTRPQHGGDIYSAYAENKSGRLIDFSANLNPIGMPNEIKRAISENIACYECYPDPFCRELRAKIAEAEGFTFEHILCSNGAADLFFRIATALKPNRALLPAPTFSEYEQALKTVSCMISYYKLEENDSFSINERILEQISENLDILFLCNPNNPTGMVIKKELMLKIADKCKACNVILVVDECFVDFVENEEEYSIAPYIGGYENLIIIKAFTKLYSMAGIRLGYMLCSNGEILSAVSESGQAWSVSTVASKCGIAALSIEGFKRTTKRLTAENRKELLQLLAQFEKNGLKAYPSSVNYILLNSSDIELDKKLITQGILIRSCKNYHNLDEHFFRIAVKSKEQNHILIDCIKRAFE